MTAKDNEELHTIKPVMDPREPPPAYMKGVFKKYQKMKPAEIEQDPGVLDFERPLSDDIEIAGSIAKERLAMVFKGLLEDIDTPMIDDQMIYRHKALPGLLILPSLLPSSVQSPLLSRLLHRDLSNQKHQTNLHMFYSIPYPKDTCPQDEKSAGDASFFSYPPSNDGIFMPKDPTIHKPLSISKVLEKSLRWVTLGGQYDWTNKVYPDEEPPKFPLDMAELLEGMFPEMKAQAAIVNLYSPGDTLSLHRDVCEESDRGLVSISLGCDCLFVVGLSDDPSDSVVIRLRCGDGIFMSEQARFAWHGVPKVLAETCPSQLSNWPGDDPKYQKWRGWMRTKRINLNVRQMYD